MNTDYAAVLYFIMEQFRYSSSSTMVVVMPEQFIIPLNTKTPDHRKMVGGFKISGGAGQN